MCDKAVHDSLAALKLISDWFVTSEMIKKLNTAFVRNLILLCTQIMVCSFLMNFQVMSHFAVMKGYS